MTMQDILDDYQRELDCPGIIMGVETGATDWYGAAGGCTPEDTDKPFYIYSLTKTYMSACILKLVEKAALGLDDPLILYMPWLNYPEGVTIRRLLNHTNGIVDYTSLPEYEKGLLRDPSTPLSRDELMRLVQAKGLGFTPGTRFMYSNSGYMFLHRLIEIITGGSYAEAIQRFVVEPLGLQNTCIASDPDRNPALLPGYANESPFDGNDMRLLYHPDWVATGLIISTLREVNRFYRELFAGNVLSQGSLREMTQSVEVNISCPPFVSPRYGLGLNHDPDYPLGETYGHGGGGPGYGIYAGYMSDLKGLPTTFCAVCNMSLDLPPWTLWSRVMEFIGKG